MKKQRRSVSLEPEVHEYLSREEVNASALVNDLVRQHMEGVVKDAAVLRLRKQQVQSEVDHLRARAENKVDELEELEARLESSVSQHNAELEESLEKLQRVEHEPTNPAIQKHAEKLDMTPKELIDELDAYGGDA
jgi:DNA anti-recombination protein RmuC